MEERLFQAAIDLGEQIERHTGRAKDGSVYWRGPAEYQGEMKMTPLAPLLYPGTTGVALFLAALENVLGDGRFGALCREGLEPLRRELVRLLDEPERWVNVKHGIGGLSGLSSLCYALVRIGDLLGDEALYDFAHDLSTILTPERIERDTGLDVMLGSAGAILAFLALDERRPGENRGGHTPLALAHLGARHLLDRRQPTEDGRLLWLNPSGEPRAGFCHGSAGIAQAFLRLYRRAPEVEYLQAAKDALFGQDQMYDTQQRDWCFTRFPEPQFLNSWCKGAPGVAISLCEAQRLAEVELFEAVDLEDRLARAVEITGHSDLSPLDDVCCGNFGRLDGSRP